jgi:hypothetical protein
LNLRWGNLHPEFLSSFALTDLFEFLRGRLEDAQTPSLALRIEACQRLSERQRFVWIEPQPFRHDRRPQRQDRRSIDLNLQISVTPQF